MCGKVSVVYSRFVFFCMALMVLGILPQQVHANFPEKEYILIKTPGLGLSERQAKLNAYENFINKIFHKDTLNTLNFSDTVLADEAVFLTDAMRQIVLENIDYTKVDFQSSDLYKGEAKLNRYGLNQIYNFILPRISIDIVDLSEEDREIAALESVQLAMILYEVNQNSKSKEDLKKLEKILSRADYYLQRDSTGLAVFPPEYFTKNGLKIDGEIANSNEVFLPQGTHGFIFNVEGYFPVSGYFQLKKGDIKKIPLVLIKRPEAAISVALKNQLSNELSRYKRSILESYGWTVNQNANFVIESRFSYHNEKLENNYVKRKVIVSFRFGENASEKKNFKPSIKPSTELYQQRYENEFVYSENDLETLARQQRLLFINSLLEFLAKFDQQDYRYIYYRQDGTGN